MMSERCGGSDTACALSRVGSEHYYRRVPPQISPTTSLLLVMRHAEAEAAPPGHPDFERHLTPRGIRDSRAMGSYLRRLWPELASILCSSATRTRETAFNVLEAYRPALPRLNLEPALYLAEVETLAEWIRQQAATPLLLIGHNPGLEELVQALLKPSERVKFTGLTPAALVGLAFEHKLDIHDAATAQLTTQMQPRQLGANRT